MVGWEAPLPPGRARRACRAAEPAGRTACAASSDVGYTHRRRWARADTLHWPAACPRRQTQLRQVGDEEGLQRGGGRRSISWLLLAGAAGGRESVRSRDLRSGERRSPPSVVMSALFSAIAFMQSSSEPPGTQVKVTSAVLAPPMAAVHAAMAAFVAGAGMHQRTEPACGAGRRRRHLDGRRCG